MGAYVSFRNVASAISYVGVLCLLLALFPMYFMRVSSLVSGSALIPNIIKRLLSLSIVYSAVASFQASDHLNDKIVALTFRDTFGLICAVSST